MCSRWGGIIVSLFKALLADSSTVPLDTRFQRSIVARVICHRRARPLSSAGVLKTLGECKTWQATLLPYLPSTLIYLKMDSRGQKKVILSKGVQCLKKFENPWSSVLVLSSTVSSINYHTTLSKHLL